MHADEACKTLFSNNFSATGIQQTDPNPASTPREHGTDQGPAEARQDDANGAASHLAHPDGRRLDQG